MHTSNSERPPQRKESLGTIFYLAIFYTFLMTPIVYGLFYLIQYIAPNDYTAYALEDFWVLLGTSYAIGWLGCFVFFFVSPRL